MNKFIKFRYNTYSKVRDISYLCLDMKLFKEEIQMFNTFIEELLNLERARIKPVITDEICIIVDDRGARRVCKCEKKAEPNKVENKILKKVDKVIFKDPVTVVFWKDGTRTTVKCTGDEKYDPEKGFAMAVLKKLLGNKYDYYVDVQEVISMFSKVDEPTTEKVETKAETKSTEKTTKKTATKTATKSSTTKKK